MKKYRNLIIVILVFMSLTVLSCSNMHLGTSVGVGVNFGSNGPSISPHMNVGLTSGGYYH